MIPCFTQIFHLISTTTSVITLNYRAFTIFWDSLFPHQVDKKNEKLVMYGIEKEMEKQAVIHW